MSWKDVYGWWNESYYIEVVAYFRVLSWYSKKEPTKI
jgi:hypothetical protein